MVRCFMFTAAALLWISLLPGCGAEQGNTVSAPPEEAMSMEEVEERVQEQREREAKEHPPG